ncbi:MAG TPA: molybdate ABC transporter substrate-binding protein [Pseudolabrys sp.]|nr:molybdate ABC transporter substrate-binding protein [Pseudolabrys sp.]
MSRTLGRLAAIAVCLIAQATVASAAEIKTFSSIGVQAALEELAVKFEKATGNKLVITWGTGAGLAKRVQAGESADLLVLTRQGVDMLAKDSKIDAGTDANFASSGMGVAVKKGATKPDISTPEAFKKTMLAAKSIGTSSPSSGGASGAYFLKLSEALGIADEVKAKLKYPPDGSNAADLAASGEAELAVAQEPEVKAVAGADLVGPFPGALNHVTMFTAAIGTGSKQSDAAKALIKYLQSPEAAAVFKARGLVPATAAKAS